MSVKNGIWRGTNFDMDFSELTADDLEELLSWLPLRLWVVEE